MRAISIKAKHPAILSDRQPVALVPLKQPVSRLLFRADQQTHIQDLQVTDEVIQINVLQKCFVLAKTADVDVNLLSVSAVQDQIRAFFNLDLVAFNGFEFFSLVMPMPP